MNLYYCHVGVDYTGIYITAFAESLTEAVELVFAQYDLDYLNPITGDDKSTVLEYSWETTVEEYKKWLYLNLQEYNSPVAFVTIHES